MNQNAVDPDAIKNVAEQIGIAAQKIGDVAKSVGIVLKRLFENLREVMLSDEEFKRFLKKERHRRRYQRMMERRKR